LCSPAQSGFSLGFRCRERERERGDVQSNTSPTAKKAACIFQSKAIDNNTPITFGMIPLSHQDQAFTETRYWRLPVSAAAIFAVLIERLAADSSECEDIMLASNIRDIS
jgi:hypothetical protein